MGDDLQGLAGKTVESVEFYDKGEWGNAQIAVAFDDGTRLSIASWGAHGASSGLDVEQEGPKSGS